MKNTVLYFCLSLLLFSCSKRVVQTEPVTKNQKYPKNIILMIGDGMGLAQISAGLYSNGNHLNFERFTEIGLHKSYSGNNLITDSAAGATAFSCGCKSYNGAIGVKLDSTTCKTIMESLKEKGLTTGLLVTCSITHATPACFYAHQPSRALDENIASDLVKSDVDFFIGGGKKFFDRRSTDDRNLVQELKNKAYIIQDYFQDDLTKENFDATKKYGFFTADDSPLPSTQGRDYEINVVDKSLNYLNTRGNKNGFFYMIEGSQIDWGGHAANSDWIISEVKNFDATIGKVLDFAKKDGNTLVIVTADHETGGYAILEGSKTGSIIGGFADKGKPNSKSLNHTGSLIPVFAYGPGAENFRGIYENTAIFDKIKSLTINK